MALHSSKLPHWATRSSNRACCSRVRVQLLCIHKEYSRQGVEPAEKPASRAVPTTPDDIVIECLTLLRKGELSQLGPYLPQHRLAPPGAPVPVAGVPVHEQGPLARCSPFMDTAARRVLPGHLLRRARIQSSLQLGGSCLLRVSLTACTGEEVMLNWKLGLTQLPGMVGQQQHLQQLQQAQKQQQAASGSSEQQLHKQQVAGGPSSSSSSGDDSSSGSSSIQPNWQVLSCERDNSADNQPEQYPKGPHPRSSPELVVLAQLHALRRNDVISACGFNMLGRHASGSGWDAHLAAFQALLRQPHYQLLAGHNKAELGSSALPSQRHFLQEVVLYENDWSDDETEMTSDGGRKTSSRGLAGRFLWRLGMQADGCWMVRSIEVL